MRICCLTSIFMLTGEISVVDVRHSLYMPASKSKMTSLQDIRGVAINYLWISLAAAMTCLLSAAIFLRWTSLQFPAQLAKTTAKLRSCLSFSIDYAFARDEQRDHSHLVKIHQQLLRESSNLNSLYHLTAFELRVGHVPSRWRQLFPLKPFMIIYS